MCVRFVISRSHEFSWLFGAHFSFKQNKNIVFDIFLVSLSFCGYKLPTIHHTNMSHNSFPTNTNFGPSIYFDSIFFCGIPDTIYRCVSAIEQCQAQLNWLHNASSMPSLSFYHYFYLSFFRSSFISRIFHRVCGKLIGGDRTMRCQKDHSDSEFCRQNR